MKDLKYGGSMYIILIYDILFYRCIDYFLY